MKSKSFGISIPFLILFAVIQFPVKLAVFPAFTQIYVYLLPLAYLVYRWRWVKDRILGFWGSFSFLGAVLFIFSFIISAIWPVIFGTWDFSFIEEYWSRFFIVLLKNVFLYCFYDIEIAKGKGTVENYFLYFFGSIILYVAFTGVTVLFPGVRNIAMKVFYLSESDLINLANDEYVTRFGWSGWSGFDETMRCSFGVLLGCIFMVYTEQEKKENLYLILSCLMFAGTLFYGRTGLFACLAIFFLTGVLAVWKKKTRLIKKFLGIFTIGVVALIVLYVTVPAIRSWFNWAFSAFFNLFTSGSFLDDTGSMQRLTEDMYWIPGVKTIFFGDARYANADGTYYMHTDTGLMRHMLFFGIINYIIEVIASFIIIQSAVGRFGNHFQINRKEQYFLMFIFVVALGLFEFKGESLNKLVCLLAPLLLDRSAAVVDLKFWPRKLKKGLKVETQ